MTAATPTLHMICGKIASGKSTLAAALARAERTVLISEDAWLSALFAGEMSTGADYVRCASKLQTVMGPHVVSVLGAGVSVVLDFPANTPAARAWMRGLFERAGASHQLHLLDLPDAVCLSRLRARNARAAHPFAVTDAQFRQFSRHFQAPSADENFSIVNHAVSG